MGAGVAGGGSGGAEGITGEDSGVGERILGKYGK